MDTTEEQKLKLREAILENREKYEGNNMTFSKSQKYYDMLAEKYEEQLLNANVRTHEITAETVADLYPSDVRDKVKILDVGAGTGMVGSALRGLRFKHIDALEPNPNMLGKAKLQNRYETYFIESVNPEESSSIKNGTYDAITMCATLAEAGHIPPEAIKGIVRMVKKGGYMVIVNRVLKDETLNDIDAVMDSLEADKKMIKVTRKVWPGYNEVTGDFGITWVYRVL
ncbi:ubiE/COQ5 methyltransferase [Mactra antiquata]